MNLKAYRERRDFTETPEPSGLTSKGELKFCIQMHDARRLHYDFRLEVDGVLKSWAVPKGPSLNPSNKRLAIQVEDHPMDYRTFEGTIPEGNYGAGEVIVWDEGTYTAYGATTRRESEQMMRQMLDKGHVHIILQGEKLKGDWSLVRLPGGASDQWLLIKGKDEYVSTEEVRLQSYSVRSERELNPHLDEGKKKPRKHAQPSD